MIFETFKEHVGCVENIMLEIKNTQCKKNYKKGKKGQIAKVIFKREQIK